MVGSIAAWGARRSQLEVRDLAVERWGAGWVSRRRRRPTSVDGGVGPVDRHLDEQLHEARASFAGVLGAVELLSREDTELLPEQRQWLTAVLDKELHRIGRMLEGFPAPPGPCSVDAVLEPIVVARRLTGQDVRWRPSRHSAVIGRDHLAEVINILLVNAQRHAPGAPVAVDVTAVGGEVGIRVTDEGPGIPPALRPRVFDWGVRGECSSGTGLGLAVAHRLAAESGGELSLLDVTPGSSFLLRLPMFVSEARP